MSTGILLKNMMIASIFLATVSAFADDAPPAQAPSKDIIIENGYVAEPSMTNPKTPEGEEDEARDKVYNDPYMYDFDSMGGKYDGGAHAAGMHGGGGGGRR